MIQRFRQKWRADAVAPVNIYHVDVMDGVRALSIFIVAWFHIWQQSWLSPTIFTENLSINLDPLVRAGYIFVDTMLLISGFLMFLPYARSRAQGSDKLPDIKTFYMRRGARILPSYWLSLAIVLFCFALPLGWYGTGEQFNVEFFWSDLLSHLTFTHVFSYNTYIATKLNVVLWTLAIEVQFYLIFPWIARVFVKHPIPTYLVMVAAAFAFRGFLVIPAEDSNLLVNQLPAFLDVYANGMLFAILYVRFSEQLRHTSGTRLLFSALSVLLVWAIWQVVQNQASMPNHEAIRKGQATHRYLFSLLNICFVVCAANAGKVVRFLLSNRVMRLFSAVSFQFYIYHQFAAVQLKRLGIPPSISETPHMDAERIWQWQYTLLAFAVPLILSIFLTYCFERPIAKKILDKWGRRGKAQKPSDPETATA